MVSSRFRAPYSTSKRHLETFLPKGPVTEERRKGFADRVIGRHARFGKRVILQQAGTVPGTVKEKSLLSKIQEQIHGSMQKRGAAGSVKLERLLSVQRVLQESLKLRQRNGGRDPNVYQVLGKIALVYGLDSAELEGAVTTMSTLYIKRENVTWIGSPRFLYSSIKTLVEPGRKNVLSSVEELLYRKQAPMTNKDICLGLNLDFQKKNRVLTTTSLQLLETAMFAKKLPLFSPPVTGGQLSVWCHRAYRPKLDLYKFSSGGMDHFNNVPMEILNQIYVNGGKYPASLMSRRVERENTGAIFGHDNVNKNLTLLTQAGLVTVSKIPQLGVTPFRRNTGSRASNKGTLAGTGTLLAELTPLGRKLWENAVKTNILGEQLRMLLLGERELPNLEPQNRALIKRPRWDLMRTRSDPNA